jgi:hypothetical protein
MVKRVQRAARSATRLGRVAAAVSDRPRQAQLAHVQIRLPYGVEGVETNWPPNHPAAAYALAL